MFNKKPYVWYHVPKTVEEAPTLDAKNGNAFWVDAMAKEIENVRVACDILPDG